MQAGRLRHRVDIQRPLELLDEAGQPEVTWVNQAESVPASIEPISGREFFAAQQVQADATTRIRIRYRPGLTEKMRAVHTMDGLTELYDIESIIHLDERRREMHLMCRRREAAGGFRG
ncbi:MAG: phage head closure protein [Gammaproteobacteria bacterium]|nr:phage head closure protein [Gammaproteobacteria bacterium]